MKKGLTQQFTSYVKMQDVKALLDVAPGKYDAAAKKADVKPLTMNEAFTSAAKDNTYSKSAEMTVDAIIDTLTPGAGATASIFSLGLELVDNLSGADVLAENASTVSTAFKAAVELRDNAAKTKTEQVKRIEAGVEALENVTTVKADKKIGTVVALKDQQRTARKMSFGIAA